MKLFSGRKFEYEPKKCGGHHHHHQAERNFVTAAEFSAEHPYGEPVALMDFKSGSVKVYYAIILSRAIVYAVLWVETILAELNIRVLKLYRRWSVCKAHK